MGTGTGLSTCWLLEGMDSKSTLITVDNEPKVVEVAKKHLSKDTRVSFNVMDGSEFLKKLTGKKYSLSLNINENKIAKNITDNKSNILSNE